MDAESTTFPTGYFDLIVINGVLHHLDLDRAYMEVARVMKDTGLAIATEALRHNVFIHLYRKLTPHLRTAWEVEHILGRDDILRARRYFAKVEVDRFFHLATLAGVPLRNTALFESARMALSALDSLLLRAPILKWQAWMAVFSMSQPLRC